MSLIDMWNEMPTGGKWALGIGAAAVVGYIALHKGSSVPTYSGITQSPDPNAGIPLGGNGYADSGSSGNGSGAGGGTIPSPTGGNSGSPGGSPGGGVSGFPVGATSTPTSSTPTPVYDPSKNKTYLSGIDKATQTQIADNLNKHPGSAVSIRFQYRPSSNSPLVNTSWNSSPTVPKQQASYIGYIDPNNFHMSNHDTWVQGIGWV